MCCQDRSFAMSFKQPVKNITNKKPNEALITFDRFAIINNIVDLGSNQLIIKITECFDENNKGKEKSDQVNMPSRSMLKTAFSFFIK